MCVCGIHLRQARTLAHTLTRTHLLRAARVVVVNDESQALGFESVEFVHVRRLHHPTPSHRQRPNVVLRSFLFTTRPYEPYFDQILQKIVQSLRLRTYIFRILNCPSTKSPVNGTTNDNFV